MERPLRQRRETKSWMYEYNYRLPRAQRVSKSSSPHHNPYSSLSSHLPSQPTQKMIQFFLQRRMAEKMTAMPSGGGRFGDQTWKRIYFLSPPPELFMFFYSYFYYAFEKNVIILNSEEEVRTGFGDWKRVYRRGGHAVLCAPIRIVNGQQRLTISFRYSVIAASGREANWISLHHHAYKQHQKK